MTDSSGSLRAIFGFLWKNCPGDFVKEISLDLQEGCLV